MLFRPALMIALVPDIDNDRRLAVIPAVGGDAGILPDRGARAVGGDDEARVQRRAVSKLDGGSFAVMTDFATRRRAQIDAVGLGFPRQYFDEIAVLDHMGERLPPLHHGGNNGEERAAPRAGVS